MARLSANPNAEASISFDVVAPAVYKMRVEEITEFQAKSGSTCWKLRASYTDPSAAVKLDGTPAKNPGTVVDSGLVVAPADKQGKLRSFVESCGLPWGDLDSEQLIGCEFDAKIDTENYNGELKNRIAFYIKQK